MSGMNWRTVRLELASSDKHPNGSVGRALILHVPIASDGHIDPIAIDRSPERATVRRFWGSEQDCYGLVKPGEGNWSLQCAKATGELLIFSLESAQIHLDGLVKVRQPEGHDLPFRVVSVRSASHPG
jgi:hypothetical protein